MNNKADKLFRALEIMSDQFRVYKNLLPKGHDLSDWQSKPVSYFKQYGFKVPQYYSDIYFRYNGIKSEKYVSGGLYYYSISPYLVNMNYYQAYDDKNLYHRLFPKVKQPSIVLQCMNGRFFIPSEDSVSGVRELDVKDAVMFIREHQRVVIKPSVGTGGGTGVELMEPQKLSVDELVRRMKEKKPNFIMQDVLYNHPTMKRLNSTSLNTCRIYTYRRVGNGEYVVLGSAVRFGGNGSILDNACSGGGFCKIYSDGLLDDRIYSYNNFEHRSLKSEKSIDKMYIPHYQEMVSMCLELHRSLPYIDIIGWDVAVDDEDSIVLIEYNYSADSEFLQIFNGPMFGDYTDELMEHLTEPINQEVIAVKRSFAHCPSYYEYIFDMSKTDSL